MVSENTAKIFKYLQSATEPKSANDIAIAVGIESGVKGVTGAVNSLVKKGVAERIEATIVETAEVAGETVQTEKAVKLIQITDLGKTASIADLDKLGKKAPADAE